MASAEADRKLIGIESQFWDSNSGLYDPGQVISWFSLLWNGNDDHDSWARRVPGRKEVPHTWVLVSFSPPFSCYQASTEVSPPTSPYLWPGPHPWRPVTMPRSLTALAWAEVPPIAMDASTKQDSFPTTHWSSQTLSPSKFGGLSLPELSPSLCFLSETASSTLLCGFQKSPCCFVFLGAWGGQERCWPLLVLFPFIYLYLNEQTSFFVCLFYDDNCRQLTLNANMRRRGLIKKRFHLISVYIENISTGHILFPGTVLSAWPILSHILLVRKPKR